MKKNIIKYLLYFIFVLLLIIVIGAIFNPHDIPIVNAVIATLGTTLGLIIVDVVDTLLKKRRDR